jgi:3',5'-cyclic AMP phosphodiesterase CpdA
MLSRRSFVQSIILVFALGARIALAAPWSFGVISDTQWSPANAENNSVAIHIIDAINQQLIQAKVDLVLQVGDLTDKGTAAGLNTRAAHNKALAAAGIPFYPLRGNHEGKLEAAAWFSKAFPNLPGTPGNGGSSPALAGAAGRTYSFVHKGVKFILLDEFTLTESN